MSSTRGTPPVSRSVTARSPRCGPDPNCQAHRGPLAGPIAPAWGPRLGPGPDMACGEWYACNARGAWAASERGARDPGVGLCQPAARLQHVVDGLGHSLL